MWLEKGLGLESGLESILLGLGLESSFFHFDSDSDSEIVTRDSGPSHARVQAVAAVPCCAVYSDIRRIHFVVCFHVLEDKQMLNMWTTRFVTRTRIFFFTWTRGLGLGPGLWGDDRTRTRTRTLRWWLRLGLRLSGDDSDSDSDLTTWTRTQHCCTVYNRLLR